jgi:hypothetical protein
MVNNRVISADPTQKAGSSGEGPEIERERFGGVCFGLCDDGGFFRRHGDAQLRLLLDLASEGKETQKVNTKKERKAGDTDRWLKGRTRTATFTVAPSDIASATGGIG